MGIAKGAATILLKESQRKPFAGQVLTLGRQDIWLSFDFLKKLAADLCIQLKDHVPVTLSGKPERAALGHISDDSFFKLLGFSEVHTLDFSDFESAEHIFDLNGSRVPDQLAGRFDLIVDGGTMEHVFHVPNVFANIHAMLRIGGRVIHVAPSSNHIDHGFYMFSPTLFSDFYAANGFDLNALNIFRYTPRHDEDPWEVYRYSPGCLESMSFGGLDSGMYGICCIATKGPESTGNVIPQQGYYTRTWSSAGALELDPVSLDIR